MAYYFEPLSYENLCPPSYATVRRMIQRIPKSVFWRSSTGPPEENFEELIGWSNKPNGSARSITIQCCLSRYLKPPQSFF